jgi:hypothetical protein
VAKRRRYDTAPTKRSDRVVFPVEIKLNVDASHADVLAALALDPAAGSTQRIWFAEGRAGVERGELPLLANHVIVALKVGGGGDELTVKLAPCVERQLVGRWMAPFETKLLVYRIEGQWSGHRRGLAASAVSQRVQGSLLEVVGAYADPAETITIKQRQFLNECAPPDVRLDRLVALGPIDATKWSDVAIAGFTVNVERWKTSELDMVELSLRVSPRGDEPPAEFETRVAAELRRLEAAVGDLGLRIDCDDDTKTARVLASLARIPTHR